MSRAPKLEPQACPSCGAAPAIHNPKPRYWYVACSKNTEVLLSHRIIGHPMFTKRAAIIEWNKLPCECKPSPAKDAQLATA